MITDKLRDFILDHNRYYTTGYADAYLDPIKGEIFARLPSGDLISLMPNDTLGDYFYIRINESMSFVRGPVISDCGNNGYLAKLSCTLVSVIKSADAADTLFNLASTLQQAETGTIELTGCNWRTQGVIFNECKAFGDKNEAAIEALTRVTDECIVSVSFNYITPFPLISLDCIEKPCKC